MKYVVKLTYEDALKLGIVHCKNCGHPPNNHFEKKYGSGKRDAGCAHCKSCKEAKYYFSTGKAIVTRKRKKNV